MKAIDAFHTLLTRVSLLFTRKRNGIPGEIVKEMPADYRKALTELKSDEIGPDVRISDKYYLYSNEFIENSRQKDERIAFDKKIKK